jgi:ubiquinone/menaquinone biosynthesis C-methylase UbiE
MSFLKSLRLLLPSHTVADFYELMADTGLLGERTMYLNLGFWEATSNYDDACQALAEQLGLAAGIGSGDEVLDCGFGFADQDLYWAERFKPKRIVGLNVTKVQVEKGRRRVDDRGLSDTIDLRYGSATAIALDSSTFDKVLALETAFHFDTREHFFHEAFRVLRPGGRLAIADIVPSDVVPSGMVATLEDKVGRYLWGIPSANQYPISVYRQKLEDAGFTHVEIRSIRQHVFAPLAKYLTDRIEDPLVKARMNPLVRGIWIGSLNVFKSSSGPDYVIASADKPQSHKRSS